MSVVILERERKLTSSTSEDASVPLGLRARAWPSSDAEGSDTGAANVEAAGKKALF